MRLHPVLRPIADSGVRSGAEAVDGASIGLGRPRLMTAVALVVVLWAALLIPLPANGVVWPWSLPVTIPGSLHGQEVYAAIDSTGRVTAAWTQQQFGGTPTVMTSRRDPEGDWTEAEPITEAHVAVVGLDVGPDDVPNALLLTEAGIAVARRSANGTWAIDDVASVRRPRQMLIVATGPQPVVAWLAREPGPQGLFTSMRQTDGAWATPERVSPSGRFAAALDLEVTDNGAATYMWGQRKTTDDRQRIWLRLRTADGTWREREPVSDLGAGAPDLSIARDGSTAVGWIQAIRRGLRVPQVAARRTPRARWSLSTLQERPEASPGGLTVLAQSQGGFIAAWAVSYGTSFGAPVQMWSATRDSSGSSTQVASPRMASMYSPHLVEAASPGEVWLLWTGNLDSAGVGNSYEVFSRIWLGDGWAVTDVVSSGHTTGGDLDVALDDAGRGCVLFGVYDPAEPGYELQASCLVPDR